MKNNSTIYSTGVGGGFGVQILNITAKIATIRIKNKPPPIVIPKNSGLLSKKDASTGLLLQLLWHASEEVMGI